MTTTHELREKVIAKISEATTISNAAKASYAEAQKLIKVINTCKSPSMRRELGIDFNLDVVHTQMGEDYDLFSQTDSKISVWRDMLKALE